MVRAIIANPDGHLRPALLGTFVAQGGGWWNRPDHAR
jgi:hypothetical protein